MTCDRANSGSVGLRSRRVGRPPALRPPAAEALTSRSPRWGCANDATTAGGRSLPSARPGPTRQH